MTVRGAVERSCLCRVCEYECMTETLRQWDRTEMNFISHEAGRLHVRFALDRHCRGFRNSQFTLLSTTTTSTNPKPIPLEAHAPPQHLILRGLPYFPRRRPCIKTVSPVHTLIFASVVALARSTLMLPLSLLRTAAGHPMVRSRRPRPYRKIFTKPHLVQILRPVDACACAAR